MEPKIFFFGGAMSQCLWSLAISLKKQPGDNVARIKHYVCLHFNIHFTGRKDMETSLCSLTMECGPSCNPVPLSSTKHHRQGIPLHFLDRLVTEWARKTWTQGHDHESCCSFCWEDMQPWPESLPPCGTRGNQLEKSHVPQESSHCMPQDFHNLLDCSGHEFIPSFGEMRQKGSHMGSLVHMSWAVLFSAGVCQVVSSHCRWKQLSLGKSQGFLTCENLMLRSRLRDEVTLSPHKALPVWLE